MSASRRRQHRYGREEEEEGDEEEKREDDPYNKQDRSISSANSQQFAMEDVGHQLAYDSMSTILEVDSEGTNSESGDRLKRSLESPLQVRTQATPDLTSADVEPRASTFAPNSDISSGDKFRGALSALAQQVERLRRSSELSDSMSRSTPSGSESLSGRQQVDASTSPASSSRSNSPESPKKKEQSEGGGKKRRPESSNQAANLANESRAASAESLMMISVSPMASPRVKYPILRARTRHETSRGENDDERKVVEVSNKSTITAIDLSLMDKMVEKYFVDTREKGTQSIKFDCEDEFETIELDNSLKRRTIQGKPVMKSIAVGTEGFSRERFSLLPPTKTRSTQTKSNMDNDIGTSETRRFKLSHLDLSQAIKAHNKQAKSESASPIATQTSPRMKSDYEVDESKENKRQEIERDSIEAPMVVERERAESRVESSSDKDSLVERGSSPPALAPETNKAESKQHNNLKNPSSSEFNEKNSTKAVAGSELREKSSSLESSDSVVNSGSRENSSSSLEPREEKGAKKSEALIPSVKTEVRVIIEIQDSKQRQRSEVLSNSQLVDGKLRKRTQVDTSKQVSTPREVYNKLESAGRDHSLAYQRRAAHQQQSPPAAVTAANQSALRRASASLSSLMSEPGKTGNWLEVSKSSVCNEIETDTRKRQRSGTLRAREDEGAIVMSSDATIRHMTNDKSAIELRSRAARRSQALKRSPTSGALIPSGQIYERTLVESEAGFDDNGRVGVARESEKGRVADKERVATPSSVAQVTADSSQRSTPAGRGAPGAQLESPPPRAALEERTPVRTAASNLNNKQRVIRSERIEIEEESEDRRQVTRNGQLVFDDRLRERKYERNSSPQLSGFDLSRGRSAASPLSPRLVVGSPSGGGILRNSNERQSQQQQQQQTSRLLKPISLSPQAQQLQFADQTSNLSSDPETMDSGFVQSGAGSTSVLNQLRHQQHRLMSPSSPSRHQRLPAAQQEHGGRQLEDEANNSLTFVDEDADVDELIDQLGGSRMLSPVVAAPKQRPKPRQPPPSPQPTPAPDASVKSPGQRRLQAREAAARSIGEPESSQRGPGLISPPPAFRTGGRGQGRDQKMEPTEVGETEIMTRLTRTRRLEREESSGRRTQTRLEQDLITPKEKHEAPPTRFKAQILFESDTDSMADRQSSASGSGLPEKLVKNKKELVSETKFSRTDKSTNIPSGKPAEDYSKPQARSEARRGQASLQASMLVPKWDYSLRVNRMRDNKVDTKVNTYIKHSRPLINSEAS